MPQINEVQFKDLIEGLSKEITPKLDEYLIKNPANVFLCVLDTDKNNVFGMKFQKFSFNSVEALLGVMATGIPSKTTVEISVTGEEQERELDKEEQQLALVDFLDRFSLSAFEAGEGNDPFNKPQPIEEDRLIILSCLTDFAYLELVKRNEFHELITDNEVDSKKFLTDYMDIKNRLNLVDIEAKKVSFPK